MIGLLQKNPNRGDWGHTFLKENMDLDHLGLPLYRWTFWTKRSSLYPWKFRKVALHSLEISRFKTKTQENSKGFTLGNSVKLCNTLWPPLETALLFQLTLRISTWYFFNTPGNFMSSIPPVWIWEAVNPSLDTVKLCVSKYCTERSQGQCKN